MRFLIQGSGSVQSFGAGTIASVAAHAALIGGALLGTAPRRVAPAGVREQVIFLLPHDRAPTPQPPAQRLRYVSPRDGSLGVGPTEGTASRRADAGADAAFSPEQLEGDAASAAAARPTMAPVDSVFSILTAEQAARVNASAAPVYPAALIERRIEGIVVARYVVDTAGHADAMSIEILQASHDAFGNAVRDAIPQMRFSPATVDGRHVRQLVEQSFSFRLTDLVSPTSPDNTRAQPAP